MTGGGGVTLFRIRGIRIAVDYSWFVVLFLIIFWLSGFYKDVLNEPQGSSAPYLLAVASAFLFFASILLHELGHAFVARRHDIGVSGITLWMFGGFARLEKDSDTPGTEFNFLDALNSSVFGFGLSGFPDAVRGQEAVFGLQFDGPGETIVAALSGSASHSVSDPTTLLIVLTGFGLIGLSARRRTAAPPNKRCLLADKLTDARPYRLAALHLGFLLIDDGGTVSQQRGSTRLGQKCPRPYRRHRYLMQEVHGA